MAFVRARRRRAAAELLRRLLSTTSVLACDVRTAHPSPPAPLALPTRTLLSLHSPLPYRLSPYHLPLPPPSPPPPTTPSPPPLTTSPTPQVREPLPVHLLKLSFLLELLLENATAPLLLHPDLRAPHTPRPEPQPEPRPEPQPEPQPQPRPEPDSSP